MSEAMMMMANLEQMFLTVNNQSATTEKEMLSMSDINSLIQHLDMCTQVSGRFSAENLSRTIKDSLRQPSTQKELNEMETMTLQGDIQFSKDEVLLLLTVYKNVFADSSCLQSHYATLFNPAVMKNLLKLLMNEDKLIGYTVCSCLKSLATYKILTLDNFQVLLKNFTNMSAQSICNGHVYVLDTIGVVFSKEIDKQHITTKSNDENMGDINKRTQQACLDELDSHWDLLVNIFKDICIKAEQHKIHKDYAFAFLSLWNKILKYIHLTAENKTELASYKVVINTACLMDMISDNVVFQQTHFLCKKALQTVGTALGSTRHWCNTDEVPALFHNLCFTVLNHGNKGMLRKLPTRIGIAGFAGELQQSGKASPTVDVVCLRYICLLVFRSAAMIVKLKQEPGCCIMDAFSALESFVLTNKCADSDQSWVVDLFVDQDDLLLEALFCLLLVQDFVETGRQGVAGLCKGLNNDYLFISLLENLDWDYCVLLDLLAGPETCCLQYLTKYLKHMKEHWQHVLDACSQFDLVSSQTCHDESLDSVSGKHLQELHDTSDECLSIKVTESMVITDDITVVPSTSYANKDEQKPDFQCVHGNTATGIQMSDDDGKPECASDLGVHTNSALTTLVDYSDSESDSDVEQESQNDVSGDTTEYCESTLDKVMTVLIRLRLKLERLADKDLFPYNVQPVVHLIEQCEEMYEM